MGVFFDPPRAKTALRPALHTAIGDALMAPQPPTFADAQTEAATRAAAVLGAIPGGVSLDYRPFIEDAVRDALVQPPPASLTSAQTDAVARADAATRQMPDDGGFHSDRFLVAIGIFALVVAAAVGTDAGGLPDSSKALYGFAASIFGVVVGLLGGEKSNGG
jgi:hypothetical protein